MGRGGRRKVSIYTQRDRENKRFIKKISKTAKKALPSKRTQRAMVKSLFSFPQTSSDSRCKRPSVAKSSPVKWKDIKPNKFQWLGCFAASVVCTYPIFAVNSSNNDQISSFYLFLFFLVPFLVFLLIVLEYNKILYVSYSKKESNVKVEESASSQSDLSETLTAEINAQIYMTQFKDSMQIMQTTANPDTFFSRFDLAKERLENMVECEKLGIKFTGNLSALAKEFENEESISDTVNYLIDNAYDKQLQKLLALKTERGRSNSNQKWYASFEPYFDRIPSRSKEYLDLKFMELKEV